MNIPSDNIRKIVEKAIQECKESKQQKMAFILKEECLDKKKGGGVLSRFLKF